MGYQAAPQKYAPLASANIVSLPLWWRNWYLVVGGLSLFFAILALSKLIHMVVDKVHENEYQDDWS